MKELSAEQIREVSGGITQFLLGYAGSKLLDAYIAYAQDPEPLFTDTEATLEYGNSFGMY